MFAAPAKETHRQPGKCVLRFLLIPILLLTAGTSFATNPDGPCAITATAVLPQAVQGSPASYTISTSGCALPIREFTTPTGILPPGMLFSGTSTSEITLSGTPTAAGSFAFSVRAMDASYRIPSKTFVIKVNPPMQIDTPAVATGESGIAYSDTVRMRGGVAPYTFSIVEGSLPAGLAINAATGMISGTMPAAGTQFRVRVTDSASPANRVEKAFTIVVGPGRITTVSAAPVGSVGSAYSFDIDSTLGVSGLSLVLGSLPPGLNINTNGVISGTPAVAGEYHFTVRSTVDDVSAWRSYRILVNEAAVVTGTPRDAEETFAYDHVFAVSGSVSPYTFSITGGSLPAGITLDAASGALLGELPSGGAGTSFTVSALDASGRTFSQVFSIGSVAALTGNSSAVPTILQGVAGATSPYTLLQGGPSQSFLFVGGTGRSEIVVDPSTGAVSYLFPSSGTYQPAVMGSDNLGGAVVFNSTTYTVLGSLGLQETELANAPSGAVYNQSVSVVNGAFTPLTFSVSTGALPPGHTLNPETGAITGTSNTPGSYSFTISVVDALAQSASRNYFIGIATGDEITTTNVPDGTLGLAYATTFTSNITAPNWTASGGTIPPGLTLDGASGQLSGIPTTAGTYVFQVNAENGVDDDTKQFTIHVAAPLSVAITPTSPLELTTGTAPGAVFVTPTGGRAPFTLSVSSGTLPDGLFPAQEGTSDLGGIPELAGSATVTLLLTDADGRTASAPYTINVRNPLAFLTTRMSAPTRTIAYSQILNAEGGRAPYTWTLSGGTLPPGLQLNAVTGEVGGIPTTNGSYIPQFLVTDADGRQAESLPLAMTVADAVVMTTPTILAEGSLLTPYSQALATDGGSGTNTFTILQGDLPGLLNIDPVTGLISNLPLVTGTFNFTVRVVDSEARMTQKAHQITIAPPTPSVDQDAHFTVTKSFSDGNTAEVVVTLDCNTGLPLQQSKAISEDRSVEFVVTSFLEGTMSCEVTEAEGAEGYTASYNNGSEVSTDGCTFVDVFGADYSCAITNNADPATFTVHKEWVIEGAVSQEVIQEAHVTIYCNNEIENGEADGNYYVLSSTLVGSGDSLTATVDTTQRPAECWAEEEIYESGVESVDDCATRTEVLRARSPTRCFLKASRCSAPTALR
jgi:hypothetical protein